jgi:hypothetical protein
VPGHAHGACVRYLTQAWSRSGRNLLLGHLPQEEFHRLQAALELVQLESREQLYEHGKTIEDVWFPSMPCCR